MPNEPIIYQILNLHNYQANLMVQAILLTGLLVFILGIIVLVQEKISYVGILYFLCTISAITWLTGEALTIAAQNPQVATVWSRIMAVGTILIPAGMYHFSTSVLKLISKQRKQITFNWFVTFVFVILTLSTNVFLEGVYHYSWGFYPDLSLFALLFFFFFAFNQFASIRLLIIAATDTTLEDITRLRAKLLIFGIVVGAAGMFDLLPTYGHNIYPLGFVALLTIFTLVAFLTRKYRMINITPAFAAPNIIETMSDALLVLNPSGIVQLHNNESKRILELGDDEIDGIHLNHVISNVSLFEKIVSLPKGQKIQDYELDYNVEERQKILNISVSTTTSGHNNPLAYVCTMRDITELKEKEKQIRFMAFHDSLTRLPNRVLLMERLNYALSAAERQNHKVCVLFIDLDQFKRINDTMGHNIGDLLLRQVSSRLEKSVRKYDLVNKLDFPVSDKLLARFGGDEFIIIAPIKDAKDISKITTRITNELSRPFTLESNEVFVTSSIGISVYPDDGHDADSLLKNADSAMYQAKASGRNNCQFFNKEVNQKIQKRLSLENDLRRALERDELLLYYQPQINFMTGSIIGVEALLRWARNDQIISPMQFIPIAEESGLIIPIGEWIMHTACNQMKTWYDLFNIPFSMAINLSVRQFRQSDLIALVQQTLQSTKLSSELLELEITESITMHQETEITNTIMGLQQLGVNLSIDDFGTGYSSLSYLKKFHIDAIKIDRSFTADINEREESAAIITAIIAMAKSLKLKVIAEGVEKIEQAQVLEKLGCSNMQGYYFSRPVDRDSFITLLQKHTSQGKKSTKN